MHDSLMSGRDSLQLHNCPCSVLRHHVVYASRRCAHVHCMCWARTVVALVLVHRLGVLHPRDLRRLGVAVVALRVVLGLAVVALVLVHRLRVVLRRLRVPVVALVLVLHGLGVPIVALGVLRLAVVALVLVHRLGVLHPRDLGRLGVAVAALVLVCRLQVVLGLACADVQEA